VGRGQDGERTQAHGVVDTHTRTHRRGLTGSVIRSDGACRVGCLGVLGGANRRGQGVEHMPSCQCAGAHTLVHVLDRVLKEAGELARASFACSAPELPRSLCVPRRRLRSPKRA